MASPSLTKSNFNVLKQYVDNKFTRQNSQYLAGFNTNAITESTAGVGININSPLNVLAGLTVSGDETYIQNIDSIVTSSNIFINSEYTIPGSVKTGAVHIFNPLALQDTCSQLNSNLTIVTTGSATFATNDIVLVIDTANNNGLYEVDTHIGTTLTVRGIVGSSTVESFTRDTVTTETVAGTITKVTISHLSTNATGDWEYAVGSTTGLIYNGLGANTVTLQNAYDNGKIVSLDTDGVLIKDNGTPIAGQLLAVKNDSETATFFSVATSGASTTKLDINGNLALTAITDSSFGVTQTPVATIGEKNFTLSSDTSDNSVLLKVHNRNASTSSHTGIKLQTDTQACTGAGGNQYIFYDSCNVGGWTVGRQKSSNTFRWNYLASSTLSLTDNINTKMYLDTSGNLHTTGNGYFSNIVLQSVPNDNTETNLLAWNALSKTVEYRTVASLPIVNPFDQTLNVGDNVEFNSVDIDGFMQLTATEFSYAFTPTTVTVLGAKEFVFSADSSDNSVIMKVQNKNAGAATHAAVSVQTDVTSGTGAGGNPTINFQNIGSDAWTIGKKSSDGLFRFNFSSITDYLVSDGNTKLSIDSSGNVVATGVITCGSLNTGQGVHELYFMDQPVGQTDNVVFGQVSINAGHSILSGAVDGVTNIEQFPVTTVADRLFTFKTDSQSVAYLSVANKNVTSTAHAALRVETDAFAGGSGGNQFMVLVNHTANPWSIGRKLSDNTIRFNHSTTSAIDPLVTDSNTKLLLDSTGKLTVDTLSLDADNTVITSTNDSLTIFSQTPVVTTGIKIFEFESDTSGSVRFQVNNNSVATTGHVGLVIASDASVCTGNGGNQSIYYHRCGAGGWSVGRQVTTNTFRWNYNAVTDPLDLGSDADTKMFLDTVGNLDINGSYSVAGNQVVGPRLAGIADASAATAIGLTDSTSGTTDTTVVNVSTPVTGVDGVGNNAANKTDVDARLVDINNNIAELTANQNALISDLASIRSALNTLLARMRSTTGHGLIS